jgi:DNA (cytosine-5)-methyltransferase 1
VGGFPCQAFSIAGKRAGFNDTRGTLFFDIARILKEKRPRHLVLENVKGLLSHEQGKTFQTILGVLADLGYFVEWQVLNSKDFGVPQNRERVFIVGHFGGQPRRKVLPIFGTNQANTYVRTIRAGGSGSATEKHARDLIQVRSAATRTRKYAGKPETLEIRKDNLSNTINSVTKDYYATDGVRIRRLTPVECERLQGFADGHTEGLSDTQRYKTLGNAVTVNVVEAVMTRLLENVIDTCKV